MNNLRKKHIQNWTTKNEPIGKELGYPQCCIDAFCQQPPEYMLLNGPSDIDKMRYKAGCRSNDEFTGFIPCADHAVEIVTGKITLESLISNRNLSLPEFPYA